MSTPVDQQERLRRWRLVLGGDAADGTSVSLGSEDIDMDRALAMLYNRADAPGSMDRKRGGSGASQLNVARWLGDIRKYFPTSVVQVMQKDALDKLGLQQMLLEPEMLEAVQPDVHLVASLISLSGVIPNKTKATARAVVRKVVDELMKRLENPTRTAIAGSLNRAARNFRPRHNEIDWHRTIRANLKHYQAEYKSIIPELLIGYGRKQRRVLREIILCIDQSGSMAQSIVYSSIFGAVMASLPAVRTQMVLFDTSVVDITEKLSDPVEVLFGTQLGGGTDINRALTYCHGLVRDPHNTILILISDLIEGGDQRELFKRCASLVASGVQFITLLALSDEGAPSYDHNHAATLAAMGIPSFACTPDLFPDLMAAAITRSDINQWAAQNQILTTPRQQSA
jgi:Mg-chelatase subunit ChlD